MKKIKNILFIAAFFLLALLPLLFVRTGDTASSEEKRDLAPFPKPVTEGRLNEAFFREFDDWFSDHLGFRGTLVRSYAKIRGGLFRESPEDSVILGKNGWLYYRETVPDYAGLPELSQRNVRNTAKTLKMMQDYCEARNMDFVFTVAPNKNTLYPENMPGNYRKTGENNNLSLLVPELERLGVRYADQVSAFRSNGRVLYQARDSHWTYEGAFLGYRTVQSALDRNPLGPGNIFENITFREARDWDADLVNMVYPGEADTDLQTYPEYGFTYDFRGIRENPEALTLSTTCETGEGNLLLFRDSFGNTMYRYFAESYRTCEFSRVVPYRLFSAEGLGADAVCLEIVERNLENLAAMAPVMEAPEKNCPESGPAGRDWSAELRGERTGDFVHLFGKIDGLLPEEDYDVYLSVTGEKDACVLACPIFEKERMQSEIQEDNGFSAYLSGISEDVSSCSITVVTPRGGFLLSDVPVLWNGEK